MKTNVDCPHKECEFHGGHGALGSADPLNQGTCLRGDGTCIKGSVSLGGITEEDMGREAEEKS